MISFTVSKVNSKATAIPTQLSKVVIGKKNEKRLIFVKIKLNPLEMLAGNPSEFGSNATIGFIR